MVRTMPYLEDNCWFFETVWFRPGLRQIQVVRREHLTTYVFVLVFCEIISKDQQLSSNGHSIACVNPINLIDRACCFCTWNLGSDQLINQNYFSQDNFTMKMSLTLFLQNAKFYNSIGKPIQIGNQLKKSMLSTNIMKRLMNL